MNLLFLIVIGLIIFILIQFFNKRYNNIFIVNLNILISSLSVIFMIFKTINKSNILSAIIFLFILILLIILYITSYIKINGNKLIIKRSFFLKKIILNIKEIKEIYIKSENIGESVSFYIYFVLNNEQLKKFSLIYNSIYVLISNLVSINKGIKINNDEIKFNILIVYIITLILSLIIFLTTIYIYFKK